MNVVARMLSAGSNHPGTSVVCTAHVIWPSGAAEATAAAESRDGITNATAMSRSIVILLFSPPLWVSRRRQHIESACVFTEGGPYFHGSTSGGIAVRSPCAAGRGARKRHNARSQPSRAHAGSVPPSIQCGQRAWANFLGGGAVGGVTQ